MTGSVCWVGSSGNRQRPLGSGTSRSDDLHCNPALVERSGIARPNLAVTAQAITGETEMRTTVTPLTGDAVLPTVGKAAGVQSFVGVLGEVAGSAPAAPIAPITRHIGA